VCARIRPLEIFAERAGYFDSSSPRKRFLPGSEKKSKRAPGTSKRAPGTIAKDGDVCAWDVSADENTAAQSKRTDIIEGRTHSYTVDKVYGTKSTTRQLYENSIHSLVKSAMEGYHSSILAYGQTSTGKTYTMSGTKNSPGLIPLCIGDCFRYVRESQEPRDYLIRVSYLEVSRTVNFGKKGDLCFAPGSFFLNYVFCRFTAFAGLQRTHSRFAGSHATTGSLIRWSHWLSYSRVKRGSCLVSFASL
jgi:hypothetical protein